MEQDRKPRINTCTYGNLIFDKGGKNIKWGNDSLFNTCLENWTATCKRMKLEHFLTSYTKIYSKWIIDINVTPETKTLRENTGRTHDDMNQSKILYDPPPTVSQFSRSVMSNSLQPHESQHTRPPCPSPTPRVHSNLSPSSRWCHPAISPLSSPSPPAPNPSQHQSLFQWVNSLHEVAKVLEFQL